MQRILVTGAAGFIGSALCEKLSLSNRRVIGIDALIDTTYPREIKVERWNNLAKLGNIRLEQIDLRYAGLEGLVKDEDCIINLAAMPGLAPSWNEFTKYSECNFQALNNIIKSSLRVSKARIIQISTSSVYGEFATGPETSPTNPISPYGVTKLAAESLLNAYRLSGSNLNYSILRYFSVYGPGQRPDMAYSKFIDALSNGRGIEILGDGTQTRSNTFIDDIVQGTILALEGAQPYEIYNLAGASHVSVLEAIQIIERNLGVKANLIFRERQKGDQLSTRGDFSKATRDFGYRPVVGIEEGLKKQIDAFKANQDF